MALYRALDKATFNRAELGFYYAKLHLCYHREICGGILKGIENFSKME